MEAWNSVFSGHQINHVHDILGKNVFWRTGEEPDQKLESEPDDAQRLYDEERVRHVRDLVLLDLGSVRRRVEHLVVLELWKGLQAEDHNGEQNDKYWDYCDDPGVLRTLGVLEQQPDLPLEVVRW